MNRASQEVLINNTVEEWKVKLFLFVFFGRMDRVAKRSTYIDPKTKERVSKYHPVRKSNFDLPDDVVEYVPLDDEHIMRHLRGVDEIGLYVLHPDSTVRFFALDFDEDHTFNDVLLTKRACEEVGVQVFIARSTRKGHHLYGFFSDFVPAPYVIALFTWIAEKCGFMDDVRYNRRHPPETFPRSVSAANTGYCIKPPLWGGGLPDHNCFVDDNDAPFPDQWGYLQEIHDHGRMTPEFFKNVINNCEEMELPQAGMSITRGEVKHYAPKKPYEPPKNGDLMQVFKSCEALNRMWQKESGLCTHDERVVLLAFAKATKNGLEILRGRWSSCAAERQIDYAIDTNQLPWTCTTLIAKGLCFKKQPCLERKPPKERINGRMVVNPKNIPTDLWPDPSPIRFAYSVGAVEQFDEDVSLNESIDDLISAAVVASENEKTGLKERIVQLLPEHPSLKKEVVARLVKEKLFESRKEVEELQAYFRKMQRASTPSSLNCGNVFEAHEGYLCQYGNPPEVHVLSNFKVIIEQIITIRGEDGIEKKYKGVIEFNGERFPCLITSDEFVSTTELPKVLMRCGSPRMQYDGRRLTELRNAISRFGMTEAFDASVYRDYGWHVHRGDLVYRSRDLEISVGGMKSYDTSLVQLEDAAHREGLFLKMIARNRLLELLRLLRFELLEAFDHSQVFPAIAHTLQAVIHSIFFEDCGRTILWSTGITGCGKSTLQAFCASFHGDTSKIVVDSRSTTKSLQLKSHSAKDALLPVDDYKGDGERGTVMLIHAIYDGVSRSRLTQQGQQADAPRARSLAYFTSETLIRSEASAIARCLVIEARTKVPENPESRTRRHLMDAAKSDFPGVTSEFILFCLRMGRDSVRQIFDEAREWLVGMMSGSQNMSRISNNVACNYTSFKLFSLFLRENGIISDEDVHSLCREHRGICESIARRLSSLCEEEQASEVFLRTLRELITADRVVLSGCERLDPTDRRTVIGGLAMESTCEGRKRFNELRLFPSIVFAEVRQHLQRAGVPFEHSEREIASQLRLSGLIVDAEDGRHTARRTMFGKRQAVWVLDPKAVLDIEPDVDGSEREEDVPWAHEGNVA